MTAKPWPWICLLLAGCGGTAAAAEVCDIPPRFGTSPAAIAIVRGACNEHRLWQRPFIDSKGKLASLGVTEAESASLADDGMIAWQRVAGYWRDSGTLASMGGSAGASSCAALDGSRYTASDCRAFLVDNPWSAAFISWVMTQAGVSGFRRSARHLDYIRSAYHDGATGPYQFTDPAVEKPAPGDMLCLLRGRDVSLGYAGLRAALGGSAPMPWKSHCDVVVAANVGGDRTLYLIGGNVFNAVMMRKMPLDRAGRVVLPTPQTDASQGESENEDSLGAARECTPAHEELCDFNRRDWAALLKLRPDAAVTAPPPTEPLPAPTAPAATQPMPPGFPRVVPPRPEGQPAPAQPQTE
ncbi:DUF2272 domain-containing protein [Xanthomonas campestris]|uniref:DUF2272 domain-containing protein n=1 Tax=Xanthomonas campestris TaxID=339 RepID=UPI002B22C72B|nr:DUF2272 domain-containing protein [Xanthomonas campestris]MEA9754150.1 DUF2272 domain-containing protein [Xanthomonas campestris pv. raphani]MEA9761955.1 DUF2272 domain-containing protein [Xanthomonas campestris pv. raphani]MEA9814559.1 DUF2272 domain-containing protein [Xanthomonas campestris pv. raphani]MEA9907692.1 DUF2272 domain-containing protein [Xanthomonas campestris pv. raphani]MEA9924373.1 DUF2272 domain-containing protein [Xanthomonas campestris pv. raphani]